MDLNLKVTIVEDNELVRQSLVYLCELKKMETTCFECAESFLDSDFKNADCFVIDFRLPGITGFELLQKVRQTNCLKPAVLVSGNLDSSTYNDVKVLKNIVCLDKPFRPLDLIETIHRITSVAADT